MITGLIETSNKLLKLNFGNLLYLLRDEEKKIIRKVESYEKKFINAKFAGIFNEICFTENILSTFTNIYIYIHTYTHIYTYIYTYIYI